MTLGPPYTLTIPGRPVQWQRLNPKYGFNPTEMKNAKKRVRFLWQQKHGDAMTFPGHPKLKLTCRFYYPDNNNADLSNLIKLIEDALQTVRGKNVKGAAYEDDKQIIRYGESFIEFNSDEPRTEIILQVIY